MKVEECQLNTCKLIRHCLIRRCKGGAGLRRNDNLRVLGRKIFWPSPESEEELPLFLVFFCDLRIIPELKKVSIITVNFNEPQATLELLRSIAALNAYGNVEIIVVDNGSAVDHTIELLGEFPDVIYIRSEENLGFAGGNNLGIAKAVGDYLFFVNNDTEFTAGLVGRLTDVLDKHPNVGIVSPKILYFDERNKIQYAGFTRMNFITGSNKCIGQYNLDAGQFDHLTGPTGYVHGAAMMVRKEVLDRAGLMPEVYFLYYEELDWCEQIRKAGYDIWLEPNARIYHKESLSTGTKSPLKEYYTTRSRILFMKRNATDFQYILFILRFLFLVTPHDLLLYARQGRFDMIKPFLKAIWWNFTNGKEKSESGKLKAEN